MDILIATVFTFFGVMFIGIFVLILQNTHLINKNLQRTSSKLNSVSKLSDEALKRMKINEKV
jgi:hypothetical protein